MAAQNFQCEKLRMSAGSALERIDTADNCYHYPAWRKWTVVAVTSWMALGATFSSTSLFSAANEIASDFSTTAETINISSAGVLFAMGISSFVWIPIGLVSQNPLPDLRASLISLACRQEACLHCLRNGTPTLHNRNSSCAKHACLRGSACPLGLAGNILPRCGTDNLSQILSTCE